MDRGEAESLMSIGPACVNAGAYAERIDEQLLAESILDKLYNQILKAEVIVSDYGLVVSSPILFQTRTICNRVWFTGVEML